MNLAILNIILTNTDTPLDSQIQIFLYPTMDRLYTTSSTTVLNLTVCDITGSSLINQFIGEAKTLVDIHTLNRGIYILEMTLSNGTKVTRKIIKS